MARMNIDNFVAELQSRGFDGFSTPDLIRYVNFGYRTVGRLTRWSWEETSLAVTLDAGEYRFVLDSELPTLKSVKSIVVNTTGFEGRLKSIGAEEFYTSWSAYDLTASQNRGEPDRYYLDNLHLYILPPPASSRAFTIVAEQKLAELVSGSNETPITPEEYDEAILHAAEEQCHLRARQPQFAAVSRQKLSEFFDDAISDDHSRDMEEQERVIAGRTCL